MRFFLSLVLLAIAFTGQLAPVSAQQNYFQQEVNYLISVSLDDREHSITGNIAFEYINHAPDQLNEIWVHLWPNAFKNRSSAYCRQALRTGNDKFYFSPDSSLGQITLLDFTANGQKVVWSYDKNNPDIARIVLPQPLLPEGRITIATPFKVKIPASFSRLGHVGTSYQITQWYPKPAVYDQEGWHAMPYLNTGEFYSEFGNFEVTITLPENYVVGATGILQNPDEIAFLHRKEAETRDFLKNMPADELSKKKKKKSDDPFPASATTTKTITYKAQRVHDFAWFADKRFHVLKDTARLASGKRVDCWAMFTKSDFKHWQKGAFYVKRAVEFYSTHVGEYPYPQATAVHSALSAGGGMEYPMITVIGNSDSDSGLDDVITHEVGHNWFYGLLASNERDHPWMDEGMNTYYEFRYMQQYYGKGRMNISIPKKLYDPAVYGDIVETAVQTFAFIGEDTPGDTNSDKMTSGAYGVQSYMKTAHCMQWLEKSSGTPRFDSAMQTYFRLWHFKHPRPEDFSNSMKKSGIDISWFMEQMQTRKHADPSVKSIKKQENGQYTVIVKQKGHANAPFPIAAMKNGEITDTRWFTPTNGQTQADMGTTNADAFVIDPQHFTLDYNRGNNQIKTGGIFKKANPLQLKMIAPFQNPNRTTIAVLPWIGGNAYDKMALGLLFYNPPVSGRRLQYYLAPAYAFGTGQVVGGGDIRYRIHPQGKSVKRIILGVNGRSFNDDEKGIETQYFTRYYRVTPWVRTEFRTRNTATRHSIQARLNFIGQQAGFDTLGNRNPAFTSMIPEVKYKYSNLSLPNPFDFTLLLEQQNWEDGAQAHNYLRMATEWKQHFYYASKKKISFRFYGGYFIQNTYRNRKTVGFDGSDQTARGTFSLAQNGYTDYKFDYLYTGRNLNTGLGSRQIQLAEGGFKYGFGAPFATTGDVGHSNNYLLAVNLEADLPKNLPLRFPLKPYIDLGYADLGYLAEGGEAPSRFFASGGLVIALFKGNFNIYLPVASTENINRLYKETSNGNYLRRITWSIKLDGLDPLDIADRFNK